jgi:hypothetical protein
MAKRQSAFAWSANAHSTYARGVCCSRNGCEWKTASSAYSAAIASTSARGQSSAHVRAHRSAAE